MQITGTAPVGGQTALTVIKPDTLCSAYLFNGEYPIPPGDPGWGYRYTTVKMLGTASSTFTKCKRFAPVLGTWGVAQAPGPFEVYGKDHQFDGVVIGKVLGENCKARRIKFSYDPETPSLIAVDAYYDGVDPTPCGVSVEFPLGEPCKQADVIAFYDPNTDTYQAQDTQASMLGEPEDTDIATNVVASGCSITKTVQSMKAFPCDSTPTITVMNIGTSIDVITDVVEFPTYIRFYKKTITVCAQADTTAKDLLLTECIEVYGGGG